MAAKTDDVAIAFPPLALTLLSYMFQQYAEVSVTGAARRVLEERLREDHDDHGLIYEHLVARVRQTPPLVRSVRVLQALSGLLLIASFAYCTVVAFDGQPWYVESGYAVATVAALASAVLSGRDMLRAGEETERRVRGGMAARPDSPPGD